MRHSEAPYKITGPDLNLARLVLHMRKAGRSEGGGVGENFHLCPILSLSLALPIRFSFFRTRTIQSYLYSHLFFNPSFLWPLSSAQNTVLCSYAVHTDIVSKTCFYEEMEKNLREEKKKGKSKAMGKMREWMMRRLKPPLSQPPLPCGSGMCPPLLSVKQAF